MWGNQSRKTHHNNYQQRGFQNSNGNYHRNADIGPSQVKPPFQKPNLYDHTAKNSNNKLEEATAKLIDLLIASIAKQKNIDTFKQTQQYHFHTHSLQTAKTISFITIHIYISHPIS